MTVVKVSREPDTLRSPLHATMKCHVNNAHDSGN